MGRVSQVLFIFSNVLEYYLGNLSEKMPRIITNKQ